MEKDPSITIITITDHKTNKTTKKYLTNKEYLEYCMKK